MREVKIEKLTLDQYRKLMGFKLPQDIEKIITINTYYRIIKGTNKNGPQVKSLEKLRKGLRLDKTLFDILLKNQLKK